MYLAKQARPIFCKSILQILQILQTLQTLQALQTLDLIERQDDET
jgi:hypothetical protein